MNRAKNQHRSDVKRYDVAVAYRIYPTLARAASDLQVAADKYELAEVCVRSFRQSLDGLRAKIWVLLDDCPASYNALFEQCFSADDLTLIHLNGVGNQATFLKQIAILLEQQEAEVVYLAEDDYFYLPAQFHLMVEFLLAHEDVHFVSPYDHRDCYVRDLHKQPKWLKVYGGKHWRTAASTCLTFLTTRNTLKKTATVFANYERRQSLDCSMWLSLTKQRVFDPIFFARHLFRERVSSKAVLKSWLYCWWQIVFGKRRNLWVPIPAIATHLDSNALSPNINWHELLVDQLRAVAHGGGLRATSNV